MNMNVMQPLYDAVSRTIEGYTALGITLFIGKSMVTLDYTVSQ